jgi:hypothetical protein
MSYLIKKGLEPQTGYPRQHPVRPTPFPGNAGQRMIPRRSTGWDPYEVWRTRVKASRDQACEILDLDKVG